MSERAKPPVPSECTMAGHDWFPLHFMRLRKSKWWRRATDLARARNIMLWGEAYQATPAGSLPDDDDELAEAAGFGMDIDAFLTAKAEIMAPWTLCSDGRWYHPTLCEVVLEGWEKAGERRKKDAARKAAQRARARGRGPTEAAVTPKSDPVTSEIADVTRDEGDVQVGPGTQEKTIQDKDMDADASLSPIVDEKPEYPSDFEACWQAYPHVRGRSSKSKSLGQWRRVSAARRALLPSAIARYAREGREPREDCGAPAMEKWLRDQRFLDWLQQSDPPGPDAWAGPPEVLAVVARHLKDEEIAKSYLNSYFIVDIDRAELITQSHTMFERIEGCSAILRDAGWSLILRGGKAA